MTIRSTNYELIFNHPKTRADHIFTFTAQSSDDFHHKMKSFILAAAEEGNAALVNQIGEDWLGGLHTYIKREVIRDDQGQIRQAESTIMSSLAKANQAKQRMTVVKPPQTQQVPYPDTSRYDFRRPDNGDIVTAIPKEQSVIPWLLLVALGIGGVLAYKKYKK